MEPTRVERKLTAILSADVKGYSRLMGDDEVATIRTLTAYRELIISLVQQNRGRVVDTPGDNLLAEFGSVVDAVTCAVEVQGQLAQRNAELPDQRKMKFRIGINLGDVVIERERIYGDGVNIAARLEGLAEGGGICISEAVRSAVGTILPLDYEFMGDKQVKNIAEPVKAYHARLKPGAVLPTPSLSPKSGRSRQRLIIVSAAVALLGIAVGVITWLAPVAPTAKPTSIERMALPLPDKPSIAVLPFINMSDDPQQEYFADGITDDLITDLSKLSGLFVIARNSVFKYKGGAVDVQTVGRELGVRYVLEGSIRRVGDQVRINAQLIDAESATHLWAERYDGRLNDIFALQDRVTQKIISQLAVHLAPGEEALQDQKETKDAQAHDVFLRGWAHYLLATPEDYLMAVPFLEEAVRRDPEYGRAYAALGSIYQNARVKGWQTGLGLTPDDTLEKAMEYIEKIKKHSTPLGHQVVSGFLSLSGQHAEAITEAETAIALNPNNPAGYFATAKALNYAGRPGEAVELIRKGMRFDPHFPPDYLFQLGMSQFGMDRFDKAAESLETARKRVPAHRGTLTFLVATYGFLERTEEARSVLDQLKGLAINAFVDWRLSTTVIEANIWPFKSPADLERLRKGLRKGGMPEFQDEWGLRREDKLTGDEIQELAFGHTLQGRHPISGLEFTISRTVDGRFVSKGLWSDTGVSWIIGDRLCNEWTKYRPSCAVIYRNPGGIREERNQYLLVQRSGAFPFSLKD